MNRASAVLGLVLCACVTPSSSRAPRPIRVASPEVLKRLVTLEDRRDAPGVAALLKDADPGVRARALLGLARIQDVRMVDAVLGALTDPDPGVRTEAAFAVGLLAQSWEPLPEGVDGQLTKALLTTEGSEPDALTEERILEALGKLGTAEAEERLRTRLTDKDPAVQARAGLALGVMARRKQGKLDDRTVVAALGLPRSDAPVAVRYAAAYLLAFSKAPQTRPPLLECLNDPDAEVRSLCVRGLGEVGKNEDVPALRGALGDTDYRVAVEAVRALAKLVDRCEPQACPPLDAFAALQPWSDRLQKGEAVALQPLLALAQVGLAARGKETLAAVRAPITAALKQAPNADLAWLDCRFAAAQDRLSGALTEVLGCGGGQLPDERRLTMGLHELARQPPAQGAEPPKQPEAWLAYLDHASPLVQNAALDALSTFKVQAAVEKLRGLLSSKDPIVAANSAFALAALGDRQSYPAVLALVKRAEQQPDFIGLADALADLAKPKDPKTPEEDAAQKAQAEEAAALLRGWLASPKTPLRSSAAAALSKLTGTPVRPEVVPAPSTDVATALAWAQGNPAATLTFETAKGTFVVKLDTAEAPLTSANLFGLAKKGYFDGLTFHRIVPDFVAQGGDPHGDGEGGPGYMIRCEIGHRSYTRGAFGMALSGKDTGGSQFFVTTSAQPHLDGRYTNFGEVSSGMEVVDRLDEGDRIVKVTAK